jgi:lipopolysaccharide export system permease protein
MSEKAEDFVRSNLSTYQIFNQYYLGFIPHMTALLFPLFVFIAVIFFTSQMAGRSEIIAILASGVTYNRWLRPYLMGGIFLGFILLLAGMYTVPNANKKRTLFESKYVDANSSYERTISTANDRGASMYLKIDSFTYAVINNYDTATKSSSGCFLYKIINNKLVQNVKAEKMYWNDKTKRWKLQTIITRDIDTVKEKLIQTAEQQLSFTATPRDLLRGKYTKDILTSPELKRYIEIEGEKGSENINELLVEYGRRIATAVSVIILTLMGAIVAGKKVRGGSGSHLAMGILIALLYILTDKFSTIFSTKGNLPPTMAVWIPNFIFSFVVLYLYKKAPK